MGGDSDTERLGEVGLEVPEESVGDGVDGEGSGVERDRVVDSSQLGHWQSQGEPGHGGGVREVSGDDEGVSVLGNLLGSRGITDDILSEVLAQYGLSVLDD